MRELNEIITDMETIVANLPYDLSLVRARKYGWKAAARRLRKRSLVLSKLGLEFRKASVSEEYEAQNSQAG